MNRRPAWFLTVVVSASLVAGSACATAATLPPQLVAKLETDRDRAHQRLDDEREQLAAAANSQRSAAAASARVVDQVEVLETVAGFVGSELPPTLAKAASTVVDERAAQLELADAQLQLQTEAASAAQAAALDADRRLRAIQRASATQGERDTTLGSWRFGSGGPAVSAESIDRYLQSKGSPLAGQGAAFLESGVQHEVDPRLVVAIAGAESYFGVTTCAPNNAWGWGCPTRPFRFRDWTEAIDTVTLGLRENYVDSGRTTVGEIHLRYAPPNAKNDPNGLNYAWADNVARFLVEQGGDPQAVAGVLGPSR